MVEGVGAVPDIIARTPQEMVSAVGEVISKFTPDVWIVAAAILDFQPKNYLTEKMTSSEPPGPVALEPSPRVIETIRKIDPNGKIISFKLETEIDDLELISRAESHMERFDSDLVVANLLENLDGAGPRAHLVMSDTVTEISDLEQLCRALN